MFRGKKAARILAGVLAGAIIGRSAAAANTPQLTEETVLEQLHQIEKDWPQGTIWGRSSTPGTHKNDVPSTEAQRIMDTYPVDSTYACGGYAAMVNSLIFGDAENPGRKVEDTAQIRPGDIIFLVNNTTGEVWHVMIALETPDEVHAFQYTDGNHGGHVHWPESSYSKENLDCYRGEKAKYRLEAWTRYPESVLYTGASVNAWPIENS